MKLENPELIAIDANGDPTFDDYLGLTGKISPYMDLLARRKVRLIFKNLPLKMHKHALSRAKAPWQPINRENSGNTTTFSSKIQKNRMKKCSQLLLKIYRLMWKSLIRMELQTK